MKREMKEDMEQKELNLCKILKGHEDKVFYSPIWGDTLVTGIFPNENYLNIIPVSNQNAAPIVIYGDGKANYGGELMLFPSKDQRDWDKWVEENKKVTYEDIEKSLAKQFWCGIENINCTTKKQLDKLYAINKLMNVQKYIEKGWQPDWNDAEQHKYYITAQDKGISIGYVVTICHSTVFFSSEENVHQAYEILGEDVIRQALSTDW